MSGNIETITIAAEKLYKLSAGLNRESARSVGYYDGRFAPRTQPTKKQQLHLKLRRSKIKL